MNVVIKIESNHTPAIGKHCNVIVSDPTNNVNYYYDDNGAYIKFGSVDVCQILATSSCRATAVANSDGSFTIKGNDGSTVTIPAPSAASPTLVFDNSSITGAGTATDPLKVNFCANSPTTTKTTGKIMLKGLTSDCKPDILRDPTAGEYLTHQTSGLAGWRTRYYRELVVSQTSQTRDAFVSGLGWQFVGTPAVIYNYVNPNSFPVKVDLYAPIHLVSDADGADSNERGIGALLTSSIGGTSTPPPAGNFSTFDAWEYYDISYGQSNYITGAVGANLTYSWFVPPGTNLHFQINVEYTDTSSTAATTRYGSLAFGGPKATKIMVQEV